VICSQVLAIPDAKECSPRGYGPRGIVGFDPYEHGFGIVRDAQTAKPQTFRTGDGWFVYNVATNPAQNQR
jgi:hypothetical protein